VQTIGLLRIYDIRNEAFHINKRAVNYCIFYRLFISLQAYLGERYTVSAFPSGGTAFPAFPSTTPRIRVAYSLQPCEPIQPSSRVKDKHESRARNFGTAAQHNLRSCAAAQPRSLEGTLLTTAVDNL